jgi:transcriptional regulator with XRE-family HTH domain
MALRDRPAYRGSRIWTRTRHDLGAELRDARREAGLSQGDVASAACISQSAVSRIELGQQPSVPAETLFRQAAVIGLRLSMKLYPDGPPVRDAAQLAVLATLRQRVDPRFRWRYEVPVTSDPDDRRAWDAQLTGTAGRIHVEVEVNLIDIQALERRMALKRRDGTPGTLILIVHATRCNRQVLREAGATLLEAFPLRTRSALLALACGQDPGDATILVEIAKRVSPSLCCETVARHSDPGTQPVTGTQPRRDRASSAHR